jgi:hypothetical protein
MPGQYKSCGCGARYTKAEWQGLDLLKKHGGRWRDSDGVLYEFRLCGSCGSTLARMQNDRRAQQAPAPVRLPTPVHDMPLDAMLRVQSPSK